jgi:hypothetical protein
MPLSYQPRTHLTDSSWFYGREKELSQLFSYINKPNPQNVQIVGQRRIGKSWLLQKFFMDNSLHSEHLSHPENYTFIYWDLQRELKLAPNIFLERLFEQIINNLPNELREECKDFSKDFDIDEALWEILDILEADDHHVVLLLDEFAVITKNTAFAEDFFSHLRAYFGRPSLTCITASYRSLGEMCHLGPDSPFFNIFSRIQLGLFSQEEAEGFVNSPLKINGIDILPNIVKDILRLTGPHPCFISALCNDLVHFCRDKKEITKDDIEIHSKDFLSSAFDDYTYYWQRLNEEEQSLLLLIAEGRQPPSIEDPIYLSLDRLGLVRWNKGKVVPFSIPFSQYVRSTQPADIYFKQAFSDTSFSSANFIYLAKTVLDAAENLPDQVRDDLETAIHQMQQRPYDAMYTCGRMVLDPILFVVATRGANLKYDSRYQTQNDIIIQLENEAYLRNRIPKSYIPFFHSVKNRGNTGSHSGNARETCTPAIAFLTVLETIHLAEEVYKRYS